MPQLELTILMPCLNEENTISGCIQNAWQFIKQNNIAAEILIADNGSCDHSVQIAQGLGARITHVSQKGYGNALRYGMLASKGKYIIMGDCDMSYDFLNLMPFLEALRQGNDLVMGNRFKGGIQKGAMPPSHYYLGVPFLSWLGRTIYKTTVGDFHCGLRGVNREAALSLNLQCEGMEFATEMIGAFARSPYTIAEVPATLRKDLRGHKSHLRSFRDGFRHLMLMLRH